LSTCAALRTTPYASRDLFLSCSIVLFAQGGEVAGRPLGPDDEIGILNTLTAAQLSGVLQQVAIGKVYNLSVDYFVGMPGLVDLEMEDLIYHMWLTHPPSGVKVEKLAPAASTQELALYDDTLLTSTQSGIQSR
jgi:hypothetical protein